jgi:hypothetical protein
MLLPLWVVSTYPEMQLSPNFPNPLSFIFYNGIPVIGWYFKILIGKKVGPIMV